MSHNCDQVTALASAPAVPVQLQYIQNNNTTFDINMSSKFESPYVECPITDFKIDKVLDNGGQ